MPVHTYEFSVNRYNDHWKAVGDGNSFISVSESELRENIKYYLKDKHNVPDNVENCVRLKRTWNLRVSTESNEIDDDYEDIGSMKELVLLDDHQLKDECKKYIDRNYHIEKLQTTYWKLHDYPQFFEHFRPKHLSILRDQHYHGHMFKFLSEIFEKHPEYYPESLETFSCDAPRVNEKQMQNLCHGLKNLKVLKVGDDNYHCSYDNTALDALKCIKEAHIKLETLAIYTHTDKWYRELDGVDTEMIKHLTLGWDYHPDSAFFFKFVKSCQKLESIAIRNELVGILDDSFFESLPETVTVFGFSELGHIRSSGGPKFDCSKPAFTKFASRIEEISMYDACYTEHGSPLALKIINSCPKLKKLTVWNYAAQPWRPELISRIRHKIHGEAKIQEFIKEFFL